MISRLRYAAGRRLRHRERGGGLLPVLPHRRIPAAHHDPRARAASSFLLLFGVPMFLTRGGGHLFESGAQLLWPGRFAGQLGRAEFHRLSGAHRDTTPCGGDFVTVYQSGRRTDEENVTPEPSPP